MSKPLFQKFKSSAALQAGLYYARKNRLARIAASVNPGPPVASTTFNSADEATGIVLSNGKLTATLSSGGNAGVRGTTSHSTGKWYLEYSAINNQGSGFGLLGFANALYVLNSNNIDSTSIAVRQFGGINPSGSMGSAPDSHVLGCAIDLTAKLVWFRYDNGEWNASGTANPATGVGGIDISGDAGPWFPLAAFQNVGASPTATLNCGQNAFANAAPATFAEWG